MGKGIARNFINPRLLAALLLGFSSGLPFALTGSTLQAWFTDAEVNLAAIGALSLIGFPYALKFLWAPLLDYYQVPLLGMRKGWIIVMQLGVAAALYTMANMNPVTQAFPISIIALLSALMAATQDTAIDAYRISVLRDSERGIGSSYAVFTYRIALLISGGFALIFADQYGWVLTYQLMAALMLVLAIVTLRVPSIQSEIKCEPGFWESMLSSFKDLMSRNNIKILLLFVVLYKLGDALALSLITNFLMHGLGFTKTEIGLAYKIVSVVATISGALVGGTILIRKSIYYGLIAFGLAQAFSNLMFVVLAVSGKSLTLMAVSIFVENFCSGLSTAAFMAFLMSLCNKQYSASQYALLSAFASFGRVFFRTVSCMDGSIIWLDVVFCLVVLIIILRHPIIINFKRKGDDSCAFC